MEVRELRSEEEILPVLQPEPAWTAYALCDLEPPFRGQARFIGAVDGRETHAVLLLYSLPQWTACLPFGHATGIEAILTQAPDLPASIFLIAGEDHIPAMERRYRLVDSWRMWRMALPAGIAGPVPDPPLPARRLAPQDADAITALYATLGEVAFDPMMLGSGPYWGAFDGGQLVAIAGTHTHSPRFGIGAVGGVYTAEPYRGCGLATSLTGAVCRDLASLGCGTIVLNVRQDNEPAIRAYRRLGFTVERPYVEGHAARRGPA